MASTPLMDQYQSIKDQYSDCLLLYRMGDFYELFHDDAVTASRVLGLTLTSRNGSDKESAPLAGFPYHAIDRHMPKLVNAGYKVAICEQVEDPALAKGIVKREVVEVITKGTTINDNCLDAKSNNYLAALYKGDDNLWGLAYLDLSTGLFITNEGVEREVLDEVFRLGVQEVLLPEDQEIPDDLAAIQAHDKILLTYLQDSLFSIPNGNRQLCEQLRTLSLESFGCGHLSWGIGAAGAILGYIQEHKKTELKHITRLGTYRFDKLMHLDISTIRNLEILRPLHMEDENGTLYHVLDKTVTAMGGRTLKYWLTHPLLDIDKIQKRLNAVEELKENPSILKNIRHHLREINDIERIVAKTGSQRANARDLQGLGQSLIQAALVGEQLDGLKSDIFKSAVQNLAPLGEKGKDLADNFIQKPPLTVREGNMLNPERHPELKQILLEAQEGKEWINNLEADLRKKLDISTLKVGFNKIFGYYIEVTKQHIAKIPETFIRKQTLVNAERYITPEMKERESKILNAQSSANSAEYVIFCGIREDVAGESALLLESAQVLARIDIICSMALAARENNYCRPELSEGEEIYIDQGRHPVVESIAEDGTYIPNDVILNTSERQILLLTGPNMAGKSTYLRQTALITLMAQAGSFVPAARARIGMADRIFTRVGASDRLSRGQSTFMVEMIEAAAILNNATPRSLVLLDEIGRGTSTFDGLSLAWAIVEALHENKEISARTLFATHYHELTELPQKLQRVVNIQVAVKEVGREVIFLRKILEGHCDSSYGIQVAGMAGIPESVINRAWEVLETLESGKLTANLPASQKRTRKFQREQIVQEDLFTQSGGANPDHQKVHDEIMRLNINNITPLELVNKISEIQKKYSSKKL